MEMNTPRILGIVTAAIGVLLFLVSVTGVFWDRTPVTDPGMLWTSFTFVLLGVLSFLLGPRQETAA